MSHPALIILGYSDAAMFLREQPAPDISAIISIHGRREFGVEADVPRRLDLAFDDVDVPDAADPIAAWRTMSRRRWSAENGLAEVPPTVADAAAIIEFAESTRHVGGAVLCHCHGGMSRAPAAALICLSAWRGPGSEANCVAEILRRRSGAVPHVGLVQFADTLMQRGGRLVHALKNAGR